jgi:hypothetical protein
VNLDENLAQLEVLLRHYRRLADTHGMQSHCMADFASSSATETSTAAGSTFASPSAPGARDSS